MHRTNRTFRESEELEKVEEKKNSIFVFTISNHSQSM